MSEADGNDRVTLASKESMKDQLVVFNGDEVAQEYLYPLLCEHAGKSISIHEVVTLLLESLRRAYDASDCDLAMNTTTHMSGLLDALIPNKDERTNTYAYWLDERLAR